VVLAQPGLWGLSMTEQWLSIVEYARTFQVSDMTIRRRIKTGKLHAILQDGKYFIPVAGNNTSSVRPSQPTAPRYNPDRLTPISTTSNSSAIYNSGPDTVRQAPPANKDGHVLKGHQIAVKPMHMANFSQLEAQSAGDTTIPTSLRRPLLGQDTSLVDTRALLDYCEVSLRKVTDNERRTVEKFKFKLEALEATLENRDREIKSLRQQLEDLQLLVKILERRKQT